jgi:hypothetical protein
VDVASNSASQVFRLGVIACPARSRSSANLIRPSRRGRLVDILPAAPGFACQAHRKKPPHCHRWEEMIFVSKSSHGLNFPVSKSDSEATSSGHVSSSRMLARYLWRTGRETAVSDENSDLINTLSIIAIEGGKSGRHSRPGEKPRYQIREGD